MRKIIDKYIEIKINNKINKLKISKYSFKYLYISSFIIMLIIIFKISRKFSKDNELKINLEKLDQFETNVYNIIKETLKKTKCSIMWKNQREFLNGIIRKFKPKKIIEIGVAYGGSSAIILNAIQDIKNSHLYSIDINNKSNVGFCIYKYFSQFKIKWTLFKGNIASKFMENIGKKIDMAFFDTSHFEPGEILDFLMVLPFLKEEAIVVFHDIAAQINFSGEKGTRHEFSPYIIFNLIRGKKFYPSGDNMIKQDIGGIILEKNQNKYVYDYFRALGGQWEYFLKEKHINIMRDFIKKYYDGLCLSMFDEAIKYNRILVKNNPTIYYYNSKIWRKKYKIIQDKLDNLTKY